MNYKEWFEVNKKYIHGADVDAWCETAFEAGIASVTTPEQSEPVASLTVSKFRGHLSNHDVDYFGNLPEGTYSLYTAPPLRELSDDEISKLFMSDIKYRIDTLAFAKAILAAARSKA